MSKPKAAFYWCASCGGCEQSVIDLAEDLLDIVAAIDFVFFPLAMDFKRADVEALADGELAVCFINGAVRLSEHREMAELLRQKSQLLVAYGSCSHTGGVPGLANLFSRESILKCVYEETPSTVNPEHRRPEPRSTDGHADLHLPTLADSVHTLDQVVPVDYYIPGCPPPTALLKAAIEAVLAGNLPPKGTVLAPDRALCHDCPRIDTKPDDLRITEFKRPHLAPIDSQKCLLAQGFLCLGPATRTGCDAACIHANMPCTGCLGPVSRTPDQGAAAMSAIASLVDATEPDKIAAILEAIPDPAGTFCRYSLPGSMLFGNLKNLRPDGDANP